METRLPGTLAWRVVPSITVVARAVPFERATDGAVLFMKLLPVTVRVIGAAPSATLVGVTAVSTGLGLAIVKVLAVDWAVAGGGLLTMMLTLPAFAQYS